MVPERGTIYAALPLELCDGWLRRSLVLDQLGEIGRGRADEVLDLARSNLWR